MPIGASRALSVKECGEETYWGRNLRREIRSLMGVSNVERKEYGKNIESSFVAVQSRRPAVG